MKKEWKNKWDSIVKKVFSVESLPVQPLWLNFQRKQDEEEFTNQYYKNILTRVRVWMLISTSGILLLQFIDYLLTGKFMNDAFAIRFEIFLPFSLLFILITFTNLYIDFFQYLNLLWIFMTSLGGIITAILCPDASLPFILASMALFFIASFVLFGLKPYFALIGNTILAIGLLWILINQKILHPSYTWPIIILLFIFLIVGYYAGWKIELLERKLYWSVKKQKSF